MTIQADGWARQLRVTRGIGAVGFIVPRWLLAVCNVPSVCQWLASVSLLAALLYVAAFLASWTGLRSPVLGRRGARLLALTCALNLASDFLYAIAPEWFLLRTWLVDGLNLLAWVWVLAAALSAARWAWGSLPAGVGAPPAAAPRHLVISALIVLVLGLQVSALFRARPTLWPFIDYPLYSQAHVPPIRVVHHRLHGLTAEEPIVFLELTYDALGMSWFVYHTQLIPDLFDRPWLALDELRRRLEDSDLPLLQLIVTEKTTYGMVDSRLDEFAERRVVPLETASSR